MTDGPTAPPTRAATALVAQPVATRRISTAGRTLRLLRENGLIVVVLIWGAYLTVATDSFLTRTNILLVLRQSSSIGIVAIGAALVILLGHIDLSLGSILAVSGVVGSQLLLSTGVPVVLACVATVVLGAVCGIANGLSVTVLRINSFMATLGMMSVLEGIAYVRTGGQTLFGDRLGPLTFLANGYVAGIPFPVVLLFLAYAVAWVLLNRTTFGARLYAVGNNSRASYLAGIRVSVITVAAFALAGALAGFGGLLQVSRLNSAGGGMGADLLFPVITAVVLGGISLSGGKGRILDVLIASVFLGMIANGLILLGVSGYTQEIVSGAILIAALALDRWRVTR